MTPHRQEWARVFGPLPEKPIQIIESIRNVASEYRCTILLKGSPTLVADPEGIVYILPFGNSALAKAGTGDVLSGIIVSLMAMGAGTTNAALLGGYIQGTSAAEKSVIMSEYSVTATDVIDGIPAVMKSLS
jgi:NAD(P)H-hydrate epimerase